LGHNILEDTWFVKENIGLMLGGEMIYYRLTGYRNLKFFSKIYGIKDYKAKIKNLTQELNLNNWLNQYTSNYSKGMKLKLALIRVLLIEPKILFLDEPMLGLDPIAVKDVINILKNLNVTIFLTSHQMDVVSKLCDRIAFLKEGQILKIDTQDNFRKLISEKINIIVKILKNKNEFAKSLNRLNFVNDVKQTKNNITFNIENKKCFPRLFNFLKDYPILNINEVKPSLNDVFIKLSN
jgi:ABC-2 type transport system ATP-binding protein